MNVLPCRRLRGILFLSLLFSLLEGDSAAVPGSWNWMGRRGRKVILQRKHCSEITTADDSFKPSPTGATRPSGGLVLTRDDDLHIEGMLQRKTDVGVGRKTDGGVERCGTATPHQTLAGAGLSNGQNHHGQTATDRPYVAFSDGTSLSATAQRRAAESVLLLAEERGEMDGEEKGEDKPAAVKSCVRSQQDGQALRGGSHLAESDTSRLGGTNSNPPGAPGVQVPVAEKGAMSATRKVNVSSVSSVSAGHRKESAVVFSKDLQIPQHMLEKNRLGFYSADGCLWDPALRVWRSICISNDSNDIILRELRRDDLNGRLQDVNKGCPWTVTFHMSFYLSFLQKWPQYCCVAESIKDKMIVGYVLAKAETGLEGFFGHVSALTIRPKYRNRGIATRLMSHVELACGRLSDGLYIDLFVKETNTKAVNYYKQLGYQVYRRIEDYYTDCDAFDMRKSLPRDATSSKMKAKTPVSPVSSRTGNKSPAAFANWM